MLRQLVSVWFQVLLTPLAGVLFIFRSRYLFTIGRQRVFSLGRWASHVQTGFHVTGPTRIAIVLTFKYGTITLYGSAFHRNSSSFALAD